ncbi:MAG: hypothetical protein FWH55_02435 [Oscillospiraceae bacterium]|nr:hypothetical protein [Oscillospiraceae bacterium]
MPNPINKFLDGFSPRKKIVLPENLLKLSSISVLTLDERWNVFFRTLEKTSVIIKCEEKIKDLIKERARLTAELKENAALKRKLLREIVELTSVASESDDESALEKIDDCREKIEGINSRKPEIEERLTVLPSEIMGANMELLENAASYLYHDIKKKQRRLNELNKLILEMSETLDSYTEERELLTCTYNEMYSSFHDLLGAELISELDKRYDFE